MPPTGHIVKPTARTLRVLLRDQAKDIWSDDELEDMLHHGLTWWNMVNPVTCLSLMDLRTAANANESPQGAAVLWGSVVLALTHLLWHGGRNYDAALEFQLREAYDVLLAEAEQNFEESKLTKPAVTRPSTVWN